VLVLWFNRHSWSRPGFFAAAYFLVVLSPFLGWVDQDFWRYSRVEDHLQYLAGMGPLALAAAGMVRWADSTLPGKRWLRSTLCAGLLLGLGILTWHRTWVYRNPETLWTDTLSKNPSCWVGHVNLGDALLQQGRLPDAITHFQQAMTIDPDDDEAHYYLGLALFQEGHVSEAVAQFQKTLEINPNLAQAHAHLGLALLQQGRANEAVAQFQAAVQLKAGDPEMQQNLARARAMARQLHDSR
jgi:tetratricopeptide (TPR) repeat protein